MGQDSTIRYTEVNPQNKGPIRFESQIVFDHTGRCLRRRDSVGGECIRQLTITYEQGVPSLFEMLIRPDEAQPVRRLMSLDKVTEFGKVKLNHADFRLPAYGVPEAGDKGMPLEVWLIGGAFCLAFPRLLVLLVPAALATPAAGTSGVRRSHFSRRRLMPCMTCGCDERDHCDGCYNRLLNLVLDAREMFAWDEMIEWEEVQTMVSRIDEAIADHNDEEKNK